MNRRIMNVVENLEGLFKRMNENVEKIFIIIHGII